MNIAQIIEKKIKGSLNNRDKYYFNRWIAESKENRALFSRLQVLEQQGGDISQIIKVDEEIAWNQVLELSRVKKGEKVAHFSFSPLLKYAAILIVALCLGVGFWNYDRPYAERIKTEDAITLRLDNGEVKIISTGPLQTITGAGGNVLVKHNGSQLDYSNIAETKEYSYNVLTVPYGKRFKLILSDSTIVHLNAGSSLKYPIKFLKAQDRQVFLAGEGYFDVHKDKEHPFIVTSSNMDVRVLGTKFNVSAYPEDREINTVLVEGSVSVYDSGGGYDKKTAALLNPGYKAEWDKSQKKVVFEKVNTDNYTGWIDGKLILKQMSFRNILKKLERKYNVLIENSYTKLDNQTFTATFDIETIQEALKSFTEETPFQYQINGNRIIISEPEKLNKKGFSLE